MICPLATADVRKEYESMQRTIACFRTDKCPQTSASLIVIADRADFCADIADVCADIAEICKYSCGRPLCPLDVRRVSADIWDKIAYSSRVAIRPVPDN